MDDTVTLALLKASLNVVHNLMDDFYRASLRAASEAIERYGITLCADSPDDAMLMVDYAAWLIRKRDAGGDFPRSLTFRIHNRLAAQKMGAGA